MARRHAPVRRWRVGQACQVPVEIRTVRGARTEWQDGEVVAVRGDRVVVRRYRWESDHPWWELRQPPRPRGHCHYRYTPLAEQAR